MIPVPERYYLIADAPQHDHPLMLVPLLPPAASGYAWAFVANDAEAMSLGRLTYVDTATQSPGSLALIMRAFPEVRFLIVASKSPALPDHETDGPGIQNIDLASLAGIDFRVVGPVSGVPMVALPDGQADEVGAPFVDSPDVGRDPEGCRAYMARALQWYAEAYGKLTGAHQDRFAETADAAMFEFVQHVILTNRWMAENPEIAQAATDLGETQVDPTLASMARLLGIEIPANEPTKLQYMAQYMALADQHTERSILMRARVETCLAFKQAPLFVQDMLGGDVLTDEDFRALLDDDGVSS